MNDKKFRLKNIDDLVVDIKLPVNATLDRQLKNDEIVIHTPKHKKQKSENE